MKIQKILPDPDLHYGVQPEDSTNAIYKAPQRPRKDRRAEEIEKTTSDTLERNSGEITDQENR